ncbi:MAG: hypothetical protein AAFO79_08825 [Pseudomonadota bacterium]
MPIVTRLGTTDAARYLQRLQPALAFELEAVDAAKAGHLLAVTVDGETRHLPTGRGCSYLFNSATGYTLARDKAHTATVLQAAGIATIPGTAFFIDPAHARLWPSGAGRCDLPAHCAERGYPVFIKPLTGSMGDFAEVVDRPAALENYLERITGRHDAVLVQPVIQAAREERLIMLDGDPVALVIKTPAILVGDGRQTAGTLLAGLNATLQSAGVSAVPLDALKRAGVHASTIVEDGAEVVLDGRHNLSGGGATSASRDVPADIAAFGSAVLKALRLRFGAIDYFVDANMTPGSSQTSAPLLAIEVNCNPSIQALEAAGLTDMIDRLWTAIVLELFEGAPAHTFLTARANKAGLLLPRVEC